MCVVNETEHAAAVIKKWHVDKSAFFSFYMQWIYYSTKNFCKVNLRFFPIANILILGSWS